MANEVNINLYYTWTFQFGCQTVPLQGVNSPPLRISFIGTPTGRSKVLDVYDINIIYRHTLENKNIGAPKWRSGFRFDSPFELGGFLGEEQP